MTSAELPNARARQAWLAAIPCAIAIGAIAPVAPLAAIALAGVVVAIGLVALGRRMPEVFLATVAIILVGYASMGRGFAYLGVPPLYVGEIALLLGCLAMVAFLPARRLGLPQVLLLVFMAWGALRTIPYVATYGIDALRDAIVWGYAAFALLISLYLTPAHVRRAVGFYGAVLPFLVIWLPVLAVVWLSSRALLPLVPGTDVSIPFFKAGDWGVHLAGAAAFIVAGLYPRQGWRAAVEPLVWACWLAGFVVIASISRGAMLATAAIPTVLLFRRAPRRWLTWMVSGVLLLGIVGLTNVEVDTGEGRTLSVSQLLANFQSVVGESDDPALTGSREWREQWWGEIVGYTIAGPYFWDGKGYGVNLADEDGFQSPDAALRAPHSAHLNLLARSGVPGLALWLAIQVAFATALIRAAMRAARSGRPVWLGVIGWVFAYWLAAILNMSFDVYLEGPQGGVLFWSLIGFGFGIASCVKETVPPEGWLTRDESDPPDPPNRPVPIAPEPAS